MKWQIVYFNKHDMSMLIYDISSIHLNLASKQIVGGQE